MYNKKSIRAKRIIRTDADLLSLALRYDSLKDFIKNEWNVYVVAQRRGILERICSHMKRINIKWTDQMLHEEALKYKNRIDFIKGNRSAYFLALDRKILDSICSHMEYKVHYWEHKELIEEASQYKSRGDFQKNSHTAYIIAHTRNVLDEICLHMKNSCGSSDLERSLLDKIKNIYPKVQKLRDMKVKIEGRPHIQGFDIDIYIPELRKGIEFDGYYWHSPGGLKRSRNNWPENDILNYHQLKDDWFKSKGIQILHIKEEEWNLNKEKCIKILDF